MAGGSTGSKRRWEPTALSRFIERRLKDLDLTQRELAKRLNVDQSYVSHMVAGRVPDVDAPGFIDTYARALEVSPEVFIAEAELWRYNVVPPRDGELSAARSFLIAVTDHLPDDVIYRIARGLREQYGEPPPEPPAAQDPADSSQPT